MRVQFHADYYVKFRDGSTSSCVTYNNRKPLARRMRADLDRIDLHSDKPTAVVGIFLNIKEATPT